MLINYYYYWGGRGRRNKVKRYGEKKKGLKEKKIYLL